MATIKAIEAKSVHQIQSGQVIVDLCSVVKELVENSLDAGATSVEVRFRNNGLDSIEVQDNGSGIAPSNYESIALKHHTSKLSSYDDLSSLQTFGFRGEALSSLCALSKFSITTAQANEAPKGKRLDFDSLGKLQSASVVACQKGTIATVENLFDSLPVRRKELAKNVKREYGKVLSLLQAYACICVKVKFAVKNAMPKGKSMTVFSTNANASTRENIANVYGAKTLTALIPLDLDLTFESTLTQMQRKDTDQTKIHVQGHISKPVFGEGRQTPDRQMFFVNGRPCGLPQIAKAINEVYKAFNVSQSPFIFADFQMDTNAYDVNVSPDKRTILLHDSAALIGNLKIALNDMFDRQDQTVPQSQLQTPKPPPFQKLTFQRGHTSDSHETESRRTSLSDRSSQDAAGAESGNESSQGSFLPKNSRFSILPTEETEGNEPFPREDEYEREKIDAPSGDTHQAEDHSIGTRVRDFNARMKEPPHEPAGRNIALMSTTSEHMSEHESPFQQKQSEQGIVTSAFDRMRPKRVPAEIATVTLGDQTITTILGNQFPKFPQPNERRLDEGVVNSSARGHTRSQATLHFSQRLRKFGAQGAMDPDYDESDHNLEPTDSLKNDSPISGGAASPISEDSSDQSSMEDGADATPEASNGQQDLEDVEEDSDGDYIDDAEKKKIEEARVAELIRAAEESSTVPSKENLKRATKALSGGQTKDSTTNLLATLDFSMTSVHQQARRPLDAGRSGQEVREADEDNQSAQDPETRLSLSVSKGDFAKMQIVGQFNLGFILAVRRAAGKSEDETNSKHDELFIIDQHASDEKYNFETLQTETIVGNQRLVQPVTLDLTAVEEEIVLENNEALEKNGFLIEMDTSGDRVVGQRCSLISLPLSREVVFNTRDLEELIQLLADAPGLGSGDGHGVPRPSKVRKMFAMRACRSSIMIGKTLSKKQMEKVVSHMGTIDKPWNCPHGRPTMRHLCRLDDVEGWREGRSEEQGQGLGEALRRYVAEE